MLGKSSVMHALLKLTQVDQIVNLKVQVRNE